MITPFELTDAHAGEVNSLLADHVYVTGIRDETTGEVRFHAWTTEWKDSSLGWWVYGNMGCDCNRHLMFHDYTEECYNDDVSCNGGR